jgi:hypothetical protein
MLTPLHCRQNGNLFLLRIWSYSINIPTNSLNNNNETHFIHPEVFLTHSCRACQTSKEETSHLFAFCEGLSQIRMRTLCHLTLPDQFNWTPHQLLSMIVEIDKICPEEGTDNLQTSGANSQAVTNITGE